MDAIEKLRSEPLAENEFGRWGGGRVGTRGGSIGGDGDEEESEAAGRATIRAGAVPRDAMTIAS
jgi:hypothetical protein